jgi:beta-glucosidase
MRTLNGAWTYSWQGDLADEFTSNYNTIYEAVSNSFGSRNVKFIPGIAYKDGGNYYEMDEINIKKAVDEGIKSDVIILCIGENSYTEKPGDLNDLNIHKLQLKLALELSKTGKPIVLIINSGRPRLITDFEPFMSAIINVYLPGNHGGDALADILSGKINPSGKLPYTYPAFPNSLLPYYYKPSEVQNNNQGAYNYTGAVNNLYDFGYGLSYSHFEYSDLNINKDTFQSTLDTIQINVNLKNVSDIDGYEVIQLYSSDLFAQITPDIKRLRDFKRVFLKSGETKSFSFSLPIDKLAYYNAQNKKITEDGSFSLSINKLNRTFLVKQ